MSHPTNITKFVQTLNEFHAKTAAIVANAPAEHEPYRSAKHTLRIKPKTAALKLNKSEMEELFAHHESKGRHEVYSFGELVVKYICYDNYSTDVHYDVSRYHVTDRGQSLLSQRDTVLISSDSVDYDCNADYVHSYDDIFGGVDENEMNAPFFEVCR